MNILFTSAGRRVALLKLFRQAFDLAHEDGIIVATDGESTAPAFHAADHIYVTPLIRDPGYIPSLLEICQIHKIDAIFPCFDPDLAAISAARAQFEEIGARPILAPAASIDICYDKFSTYEFFVKNNIPTVKTVHIRDFSPGADWQFPLFVKPITGYGSKNSFPVNSMEELEVYRSQVPDSIVQQLATGIEHTTDVLVDFDGVVLSAVPRQRIEVRSGEVSKGVTRKNWVIIEWAKRIAQDLHAVGPLCVQCFMNGDDICFTEINPRFGGGAPLSVAAGANQVLWMVQMLQGKKLAPMIGQFQEDYLMLRYDDAYFMPENKVREYPCLQQ